MSLLARNIKVDLGQSNAIPDSIAGVITMDWEDGDVLDGKGYFE